jgi:hypothetical protein
MNYKHATFKIDFMYFRPLEMVRFPTPLEGEDAAVVDAQVQLVSSVVL